MAQPNVAREPSMEEILASIRRIIESNDPGAGQSISAALPPVYAEDDEGDAGEIHLTVDNDNGFLDDHRPAPSRPETPMPRPQASAAREADSRAGADNVRSIEERRSMSLADVAARVRAASDRQTAQRRGDIDPREEAPAAPRQPVAAQPRMPEPAAPQPVFSQMAMPQPVSAAELRPAHDAFSANADLRVAPTQHVEEEPLETLSRVVQQPLGQPPRAAAPAPLADVFDTPVALADDTVAEPAQNLLISSAASDRVARSFEDLAAAFDAGPRRSLDEIAEEMLRPMLKDWLDDNLPTLVERLVREEIERVARGPRR